VTLFRPRGTLGDGRDPIRLSREAAGWSFCGLDVILLAPGERRDLDLSGVEAAVVPLSGSHSVQTAESVYELSGRDSVFSGIPDVAYLSLDSPASVSSHSGGRVAVATAAATEFRPSFVIRGSEVSVEIRGAGQATRQINGLLSADVPGPQRLIVVEVLTPAGNWSSYPPHKHDEWSDVEVPIEEIYYFEIAGEDGFGFHRTYTVDGEIDETVTVRSGDAFLIPRGYHGPCVAAPGYDMYYLNVMAGPDEERRWMICTDPRHAWLWDAWVGVPPDPRLPMTSAQTTSPTKERT
jgi:5-deoxy-glucuronate isomerase